MELKNYKQDIIFTSSSDFPPNYPNINNPSNPDNKYIKEKFQFQNNIILRHPNNNTIYLKILDIPLILKTNL